MSVIRVFKAEHHDPWFNLATEDWLFNSVDHNTQVLFLWRNRPSIIIGRFQNPWSECNLEAMEADGVQLARRQSGGGAVYHDLGNTNFTFMSPKDDYRKERNFSIIVKALASLGVVAQISGRNDILIDGKKVSGNAFRISSDRAFHHGTLLINTDLSKLPGYLTPDKEKLNSKGIQSVASRVANISDFNPIITHELLSEAIVQVFFETYGASCTIEDLTIDKLSQEKELYGTYEKYAEWNWRFGITPEFSHTMKKRFDWGGIEINLDVKEAKIRQASIYSDSIAVEFIETLQESLVGLPYEKNTIGTSLEVYAQNLPQEHQTMVSDVIALILKELG
jgi:lipoate---protein ligase